MINLAQFHSHSLSPYSISDISLYVLHSLRFHIRDMFVNLILLLIQTNIPSNSVEIELRIKIDTISVGDWPFQCYIRKTRVRTLIAGFSCTRTQRSLL